MPLPSSSRLRLLRPITLVFAGLWLGSVLRAVDVSGTYEAVGADVPANGAPRATVSLAALIGLQLDHARGLKEQAEVAAVQLEQGNASFAIRCLDDKGAIRWVGRWERKQGYELTEDRLPRLTFLAPHLSDDHYAFTFKLEAGGAVLVVDLHRLGPKLSGKKPEFIGTFLFTRAAAR